MCYREKEIEKLYWSTYEVAKDLGVAYSTIWFWLKEFDLDSSIKRSKRSAISRMACTRRFTLQDLELLREIHRLLTVELYTIPGARRQLQLKKHNQVTDFQEEESLMAVQ